MPHEDVLRGEIACDKRKRCSVVLKNTRRLERLVGFGVLVLGQLRRQIDELPGNHSSDAPHGTEDQSYCQHHRCDATEPALKSPDKGRNEKC